VVRGNPSSLREVDGRQSLTFEVENPEVQAWAEGLAPLAGLFPPADTAEATEVAPPEVASRDLEVLQLAAAAYGADVPEGWQLIGGHMDDSGFKFGVYERDGEVVVAFSGTDATSWPQARADFDDNVLQGLGFAAEQYDSAIAVGLETVRRFGAENARFVGHSLGGGLATVAAAAVALDQGVSVETVTLNAAGISTRTLRRLHERYLGGDGRPQPDLSRDDLSAGVSHVRAYATTADPVTALNSALGQRPVGESHEIPSLIEEPLAAHAADSSLSELRRWIQRHAP